MSRPYKDLIVDEADAKVRYNLIGRDGEAVIEDVRLEVSSPVTQEGDKVGAREFNFLIERGEDDDLKPGFIRRHGITLSAAGWSGGKTQQVSVEGVKAGSLVLFGYDGEATDTQKLQYAYAILSAVTADGAVVFSYSGTKPTADIPVTLVDMGVV